MTPRLRVFPAISRNRDPKKYVGELMRVAQFADRYVRLGEFIALMRQLLASPRPATFEGRFYRASNLQLRPRLPPELMPEFLVAGQSEPAQRVAKETGCIKMQMLPPDLDRRLD